MTDSVNLSKTDPIRELAKLEREELTEDLNTDQIIDTLEDEGYTVEEGDSYAAAHKEEGQHHSEVTPNYEDFTDFPVDELDMTEKIHEYRVSSPEGYEATLLIESHNGTPKDLYFEE